MNERNEEKAKEVDGLHLRSDYRAAFSKQGTLQGDTLRESIKIYAT
jgi:hypothetical protein